MINKVHSVGLNNNTKYKVNNKSKNIGKSMSFTSNPMYRKGIGALKDVKNKQIARIIAHNSDGSLKFISKLNKKGEFIGQNVYNNGVLKKVIELFPDTGLKSKELYHHSNKKTPDLICEFDKETNHVQKIINNQEQVIFDFDPKTSKLLKKKKYKENSLIEFRKYNPKTQKEILKRYDNKTKALIYYATKTPQEKIIKQFKNGRLVRLEKNDLITNDMLVVTYKPNGKVQSEWTYDGKTGRVTREENTLKDKFWRNVIGVLDFIFG